MCMPMNISPYHFLRMCVVCHTHRELTGIFSSVTFSTDGNPFDIFGSRPASGNHLSFFKRQKSANFLYQSDVVRWFLPMVVAT